MKISIHKNSKLPDAGIQSEFGQNKRSFADAKRIVFRNIALVMLLWLPLAVSAALTLPAIPSNSSLATRFELSTEMVFRVKVGDTYLPSGALIAYINGEIRGAQTASVNFPATGINVYKLLVFHDKSSGDSISFKYYDIFSEKIYDISGKIEFIPNLIPDYANPVILSAYCKPIDKVTGLIPENGKENQNTTVDLYWQPSPNTTSYQLYLWEDGTTMPVTPTRTNIYSATSRVVNLKYGQLYRWKIGSVNECSSVESPVQTFKVRQLPDLTVTDVLAPANIESATNFTLSFNVKNIGIGNTAGASWTDAVYVSTDQTLSNDDKLLISKTNLKQLEADSSYTQSVTVSLPVDYIGNYYFLVKTDLNNSVAELLEDNNIGKSATPTQVVLKSLPDILVKNIVAGKTTVNPGDSLTISWKVENIGSVIATGGWAERITIVPVSGLKFAIDPNVNYLIPLPAGSTIDRSRKIKLPDILKFSGDANIQVELIPFAELQEYAAAKANNIGISAGNITIANLLTLDIQQPSVLENTSGPVRCTVSRSGDYSADLVVTLAASIAGQITLPGTVTILANQSSVLFNLNTINNAILDGTRIVDVTASAASYSNSVKSITILDDEIPTITAAFDKPSATEGEILTLTVSRDLITSQALTVGFSTNKPSQWTFPNTVIIPANVASASISVNITDDNIPELTSDAIIYASSAGLKTGMVAASIIDNDVPQVSLEILSDTVSEAAGIYATWGLIKRIKGDDIITVNLTSNLPGALFFPASITLPKGAVEQKFNIGVVDNAIVDGYRNVILSGAIQISSCNCSTTATNGGVVTDNLVIADNDGPSLSVSIDPISLPEGKTNTGTLTISRNTPTTDDLAVTISHNDPTEVDIQTSAIILAGQSMVKVPVNTINDNIEDGNQMVSIQASAATFSSGYGYVFVTDQNKPDLLITDIALNVATAATNDLIEISGSAFNGGLATAPSGVKMNFYCSKDKTIDSGDQLLGEFTFLSPILKDASANFMRTVDVPDQTGNFYILAKINPAETITELVYFNNVSDAVALTITPEYNATAIADEILYLPNTSIPIHGSAINNLSVKVPNVDVDVYVLNNGTRRELKAKTDSNGDFSVDFTPLPNESGHYSIGACFPKQNLDVVQDQFDIPGLKLTSTSNIIWEMKLGQTITGKIGIKNTSEAPLSKLVVTADKLPLGCQLVFSEMDAIAGNETREFSFTLKATELTDGKDYEKINFHVLSAEGIFTDFPAYYYCQALQGQLKADPVSINTTMTKGKSRLYELSIYNNGAGETGTVTISLPNLSWMTLVSPATLPNIAPQDTATVIINLTPNADAPLNTPISGNIAINCVNGNGVSVPYRIEAVSEETGGLKVDVIDEYTYFTEAKPHLKNAHVVVRHPFSGKIIADGFTGDDGIFSVDNLPEGTYIMNVEAEKHEGFQTTLIIDPGRVNEQSVFLSFQAITYTWEVVPTEIVDNYEVQLIMKFETNVPAPVVIMDMPTEMPQLFNDQTFPFVVTLTNKGLITAQDLQLTLPQNDPEYEFVTNFTKMDLLPQQAIQVPVVMKLRAALKSANIGQSMASTASTGPCTDFAVAIYGFECGKDKQWHNTSHGITFSGRICLGGGGGGGGGGWGGWGGGGGPSRGGSSPTHYLPGSSIPAVSSSTVGCDNCLMDLALAIAGCFPPTEAVSGVIACIKSFSDGDVSIKDIFDCGIGFTPVGCVYGIINLMITCYDDPPFFLKSASMLGSIQSNKKVPPILRQAAVDMTYAVYKKEAIEDWTSEFMGTMDWKSKQSFVDFATIIDPYIKSKTAILPADLLSIKQSMTGSDITSGEIDSFVTRWNTSLVAWGLHIFAPNTDYPEIINDNLLAGFVQKADSSERYAVSRGYSSVLDMYSSAFASMKEQTEAGRSSVCASVTINITQKVVMTREAFEGTLTIFNGNTTTAMQEIKLNLEIKDENGVLSNDLFQIDTKALSILTGIDGTGSLGPNEKGSATVLFIPEKGAAPTVPKSYSFGGSFSYLDPFTGVTVTKPLFPVTLDVNPSPDLWLHYFMSRDILGDDALTLDKVEPIVPAEFDVMIENHGYGTAKNVRIESAQPKIVENEKGLAINFALIGSNLNGQPRQLGLTNIDFGNIAPKSASIGQWWFTSDLLGHFVSYETKLTHLDSRGNPDLSLISGVTLHELIHGIRVYSGVEDGINDFLVNEVQDAKEFPDIIYLSNGGTLDVYPAPSESTSGNIATGNHEIELLVTPKQIGWNYIKFNDPGNGNYKIASVTREDGQVIPLDNVWQTYVTLPDGKEPVYENMMHFLDVFASNAAQKYTIRFTPKDQNPPEIVRFENVPNAAITLPLTSINVEFNRPIDPATFNFEDMTLRVQGGPDIMDNTVTVTQIDPVTFKIDLTSKSIFNGYYVLTVQASQINSLTGTPGLVGKQANWTQFINIPAVSEFIGLPANNIGAPIDFIMLKFNLPVDKSTILPERFTWKKNDISISGDVIITPMDTEGLLFQLSNLNSFTTEDGKYTLTVDLPNVKTLDGIFGILPQSVGWEIDQKVPSVLKITPSTNGGYDSQHYTNFTVLFSEPVKGFGVNSLELWKDGLRQPLSQLNFTSNTDSEYLFTEFRLLTYSEGNYILKVKMQDITDLAGNSGTDTTRFEWTVDRTGPKAVTNLHITPDLGFSNTDNVTSTRILVASMMVTQPGTRIQVYQTDQINPILLADTANVNAGPLSLPVVLKYSGNMTMQAYSIDQYSNRILTEIPVFIDDAALISGWKSAPLVPLTSQPKTLQFTFSDKLLDDSRLMECLKFERDGLSLGTQDLTITKSNDKLYVLSGMDMYGIASGSYNITLDLSKLQKYNSGKQGVSTSTVRWSIVHVNNAPVANAGVDQSVNEGSNVSLDGSASYDADGNIITYQWIAPAGITLNSTTVANPAFIAPLVTTNTSYTFRLVVNDGTVNSTEDQVVVTVLNVNKVPVANAGPDLLVNQGATVSLDGTGSTDPDGDPLSYKWTAPAGIVLSSTTAAKPTFTAPAVTINTSYTITLKVNDGTVDSPADQIVITIKTSNTAPVANAGPDLVVNQGALVSLDGSASTDPDGNPLTYKWTAPAGITLSSTTDAKPTFIAPAVIINTSYTLTLRVNDGLVDSPTDQVVITVKTSNIAPVANAGIDQVVNEREIVTLNGSASTDADGNPLTYKWTVPAGIVLSSTTAANPTFTAPEVIINTSYTITLVVNDGLANSPADQVVITIKNVPNRAPVANAGADQSVNEGTTVSLDGSASTDADGNPLSYKWTAPAGIVLSSTTAPNPTFTAPEVFINTSYTLTLIVNDGFVNSPADQVVITVKQVNKAPVANAGPDQSVNELSLVTLDGSGSSDPDGNPFTYKWTAPAGITLSSTTVANPTYTAPEVAINTSYTFSLVVNDGLVDSPADQVVITVLQVPKPLFANAGPDQVVNEGAIVTLDGSASADPDSKPLTYKWTAPAGIVMSSTTVVNPTFTAPEVFVNTSYTITLVVNNGLADSPADQVVITVKQVNKAPVANAGPDQSVNELSLVELDGSGSTDPDGNPLTYLWTAPAGITLSSSTAVKPTFTAPDALTDMTYSFSLVVSDGLAISTPSTVTVYAKNVTINIIQTIDVATGWNIFSGNVIPVNPDLKAIFQPLIDAGILIKVLDQQGNALEDLGIFGGWNNNIGNLSTGMGYKVYLTDPVSITLQGPPVPLPIDISLAAGWNIIAYPSDIAMDAMTIFQQLIDQGKLIKVMDEGGLALEDFGKLGGWKNNIGNLNPNKGYKVNMLSAGILTIPASGTKQAIISPENLVSTHFSKVFVGNGTDHMNINLIDLAKSGFKSGDEIGIFDGNRCVGSAQIGSDQMTGNFISIAASSNDDIQDQPDGFISGNTVSIHLYRDNQEYLLQPEMLKNSQSIFVKGESMFARTNTELATKIDMLSESGSVKCYPNPFSDKLTIEVDVTNAMPLDVSIFDMNGKVIRNLYHGNGNEKKSLVWDGKNNGGVKVIPGDYFLRANNTVIKIMLCR